MLEDSRSVIFQSLQNPWERSMAPDSSMVQDSIVRGVPESTRISTDSLKGISNHNHSAAAINI